MTSTTYTFTQDDTAPALRAYLRDADETAIDLHNSKVYFVMTSMDQATVVIEAECTIVDADTGEVTYDWVAADTDVAGKYLGCFEVRYTNGEQRTVPSEEYILIIIRPSLSA